MINVHRTHGTASYKRAANMITVLLHRCTWYSQLQMHGKHDKCIKVQLATKNMITVLQHWCTWYSQLQMHGKHDKSIKIQLATKANLHTWHIYIYFWTQFPGGWGMQDQYFGYPGNRSTVCHELIRIVSWGLTCSQLTTWSTMHN